MAKHKHKPIPHHKDEDEQVRQAPKPDYKGTPFGEEAKEQVDPPDQEAIDYASKKNTEADHQAARSSAEFHGASTDVTMQEPQPKGTARTVDPAPPLQEDKKEEDDGFVLMEFPFDLNLQQDGGLGILRFKKGTQKVPAHLADHIYFEKAGVRKV